MASAAQSSPGSIPLEKLQEKRAMLRKYAQPNHDADANTNPKDAPQQHTTPVVPRLSASKSLPAAEMAALLNDGDLQAMYNRVGKSFSGGDTQEMPSQEIRTAYTASLIAERTTPEKSHSLGTYTGETQATNRTPHTLEEGDSGYADVVRNFQASSPADVFLRDETQNEMHFQMPERRDVPATPATLQREPSSRERELLTSGTTAKTPGFTQAFGFDKAPTVMTGTQAFAQTQQPSSPLALPPQSDPVTSRPEYEQPSSPSSSPVLTRPVSRAGEPRDDYFSKEESQKRREVLRAQRLQRLETRSDNFNIAEDEEDTQDRRRRANSKRQLSDNDALDILRAPTRSLSRPGSARKAEDNEVITLHETPGTGRKQWDEFIEDPAQDDEVEEERLLPGSPAQDIQYSERDEPDAETDVDDDGFVHDHADETENHSVNDEYDEFNGMLMSQRNSDDQIEVVSTSGSIDHHELAHMSDDKDAPDEHDLGQDMNEISRHHVPQSTLRSTVADSQPTREQSTSVQQVVQSSNMSFVPGSQYKGQTNEDVAVLKSPPPINSNSRVAASQPNNDELAEDGSGIPSSPPIQTANSTIPDDSAKASLERREMLKQFQTRTESTGDESVDQPEIPESDNREAMRSRPQTTEAVEQSESLPAPFSTARTHVSASAQSPAKSSAAHSPVKRIGSQRSMLTGPSPRKAAGVRHFSEFPNVDPSNTNVSFESQNINDEIDAVMSGVFPDGDKAYLKAISSPERPRLKRPKLRHNSSSVSASSLSRAIRPLQQHSDMDLDHHDIARRQEAHFALPVESEDAAREQVDEQMEIDHDAPGNVSGSDADAPSPPVALRESPSKANKLPTPTIQSSPKDKNREETSESVLEREEAGRAAVSQLVSARSTASAKRTKLTTYGRTTRRKVSKGTTKTKGKVRSAKPATPETSESADEAELEDQAPATMQNETTVNEGATLLPLADDLIPNEHSSDGVFNTVAPDRVLALFKGTPQNFYPATFLGGSADGMAYKIKFDDSTSTFIDTQHVRRLELRCGDVVKIDDPEMRKKNWRITGFGNNAKSEEGMELGTDIYGHSSIKVQISHNRSSLGHPASTPSDAGEVKEVLINSVYITPTMWPQYKDRVFHQPPTSKSAARRAETPSTRSGTPAAVTPASRSRRAPALAGKAKAFGSRASHLRETSVAPSSSSQSPAIFSDMAFAISFVEDSEEKAEVLRLIKRNGGTVLDDGFEELFELPNLDGSAATSPSKRSPTKVVQNDSSTRGLQLRDKYQELRFAACISDKHSRRAKYIQALALGLPTIHGRWIIHCLDNSKNASLISGQVSPIPWDKYLLPAGESTYIGGSIRSRTLIPYNASNAELATTIADSADLLKGEGLLIVAPRKGGNASEEKRKTFAFLTLALGAGKVKRVQDFATAKRLAREEEEIWRWVYVDGSIFEEAKVEMFGGGGKAAGTTAGKKRKRPASEATAATVSVSKMFATDGTVKLVNDEFVIQSLILGALAED